jgi:hypothetical protein
MTTYYRRHLDDRQVRRRWMDPRMFNLRVAEIEAYLLRKGWKPVPPDRPNVLVFEEPQVSEDGPLYQWIPDSEDYRHFPSAVYELLAALAEIENRYAGEVLTEMLAHRPGLAVPASGTDALSRSETASR